MTFVQILGQNLSTREYTVVNGLRSAMESLRRCSFWMVYSSGWYSVCSLRNRLRLVDELVGVVNNGFVNDLSVASGQLRGDAKLSFLPFQFSMRVFSSLF